MEYIFFMSAIEHKEINNVQIMLEKYIDASASYIISMETSKTAHKETKGQHMHYAVQMDNKQYDAFRHTCFNNTYKLRGRAVDGHPRQYGKIKQVRDQSKFLSYTVKDKNIIYKNIDLKTIQEYICKSYERVDKKDTVQALMDHLSTLTFTPLPGLSENIATDIIEIEILKYSMQNNKAVSKSYIKHITSTFLQLHLKDREKHIKEIFAYIRYN